MPSITTLTLPHLPPPLSTLHIALITPLRNAPTLRARLLSNDPALEYALLDARTLLSPTHVLSAAFRAATDAAASRMRTRNVHSELVFALGGSNNIASAFRTFGIADGTTALVVAKYGGDAAAVEADMRAAVEGEFVPFSGEALAGLCDVGALRKAYKVPAVGGAADAGRKGGMDGTGSEAGELEVAILGIIALRGA